MQTGLRCCGNCFVCEMYLLNVVECINAVSSCDNIIFLFVIQATHDGGPSATVYPSLRQPTTECPHLNPHALVVQSLGNCTSMQLVDSSSEHFVSLCIYILANV